MSVKKYKKFKYKRENSSAHKLLPASKKNFTLREKRVFGQ